MSAFISIKHENSLSLELFPNMMMMTDHWKDHCDYRCDPDPDPAPHGCDHWKDHCDHRCDPDPAPHCPMGIVVGVWWGCLGNRASCLSATTLHYPALHWTTLSCTDLPCPAPNCNVSSPPALVERNQSTLWGTTLLHKTTLHCWEPTLHCTALWGATILHCTGWKDLWWLHQSALQETTPPALKWKEALYWKQPGLHWRKGPVHWKTLCSLGPNCPRTTFKVYHGLSSVQREFSTVSEYWI